MAAPTYLGPGAGVTDSGGVWGPITWSGTRAVNQVYIFQLLQDGSTTGAVGASFTDIQALDGTANSMTLIGEFPVGASGEGRQYLWIGRTSATTFPSVSGTNSTSEDIYARWHAFSNVSTGTTLATVIENSTAGNAVNGPDTSATCADTGVTTLGVDRLAVNYGAITDDATGIAVFAGASGGTWTGFQSYESATGTDGTIFYEECTLATAGTINGGTDTITSLPWGVIGFALIGTTVTSTEPARPEKVYLQAVNRSNVY